MIEDIKERVRSSPRLFDTLKRLRRIVNSEPDPAYDFFRHYSRFRRNRVNFLQIGAADGMRNDPFREFIVRGWRGILVEPIPRAYEQLRRNYSYLATRLTFLNAAVTEADGSMTLFSFDEKFLDGLPLEKRLDYLRKVSFDRSHVQHYVPTEEHWAITETRVPCLSIGTILSEHWDGEPIDLLAVDAEGHEPTIIGAIDFETFKPETIFYESHTLQPPSAERLVELLGSKGYECFEVLGDTVAMQKPAYQQYCRIAHG